MNTIIGDPINVDRISFIKNKKLKNLELWQAENTQTQKQDTIEKIPTNLTLGVCLESSLKFRSLKWITEKVEMWQ